MGVDKRHPRLHYDLTEEGIFLSRRRERREMPWQFENLKEEGLISSLRRRIREMLYPSGKEHPQSLEKVTVGEGTSVDSPSPETMVPSKRSNDDSIILEWKEAFVGGQHQTKSHTRKRRIEKVPALLRRYGENKNIDYDPAVVSLGPYHRGNEELQLAEEFKQKSLHLYVQNSGKNIEDLNHMVREVIGEAKRYYVKGSTDNYSDEEFTQMMVLDGCFILNLIEWASDQSLKKNTLMLDHLGALGMGNLIRDLLLLENQLPYQLLQALISFKFNQDEWEKILHKFFSDMLFGELFESEKNVMGADTAGTKQQPLHLLEIYRTYFLPKSDSVANQPRLHGADSFQGKNMDPKDGDKTEDKNESNKYIHLFRSVTELKAKGIRFTPGRNKTLTNINFNSFYFSGQLEIPPKIISSRTKTTFLNMIAYEMCPNNPNDFMVTTYIDFMKSLIIHPEDVKELRSKHILLNNLGSDEEVVKMFQEIHIPFVNRSNLWEVAESIDNHYRSMAKIWIAELN